MKKVIFLIHTLGGGGAEKVLVNLVNNMDKSKFDVTLMTVIDTGIYKESLCKDVKYKTIIKFPFKNNNNKSGSLLSTISLKKRVAIFLYNLFWKFFPVKLIHKIFIGNNYDIEVAFLEGICAKIISSSSNRNSRKYAWIHVDLEQQHKSKDVFRNYEDESSTYDKFDNIVCVSDYVRNKFCKLLNIDKSKVIVKYNPIDSNEIIAKSEEPSSITRKKFTICSVGRLNKQKNYMRLARCTKMLLDKGYDFDVWIIGEGSGREEIEQYVRENKLEGNFYLLGYMQNPYSILANADLFVCSSYAEGYSTSVVESLILGKPVVTTDCAGMKEIFSGYDCGIITQNDDDALCKGIEYVISSEQEFLKLRNGAIVRGKQFDIMNNVREIEELLCK